jgi:hypothetical protein
MGPVPALVALLLAGAGDVPAGGAGTAPPAAETSGPAQPPPAVQLDLPIAISWNAPDECPAAEELKAEIRRVAGNVPPPPEPLAADITVRRGAGSGWVLTLATRAGTRAGERRLAGADCAELMRAAALVVALMINPQASLLAEPPPPPPPPPPPSPPPSEPERHFALGADVLVDSGALPAFAPGVGLRFAVGVATLSAEIRASVFMSASTASTNDANAGGNFSLADGSAAVCARAIHEEVVSPGVCAGASIVRMHGTGYGVGYPGEASAWWSAALAEANLRGRVGSRNAVRLAAQMVVPIGRPSFDLAGVGHVFEPAAIWLRGTLGWELHF